MTKVQPYAVVALAYEFVEFITGILPERRRIKGKRAEYLKLVCSYIKCIGLVKKHLYTGSLKRAF